MQGVYSTRHSRARFLGRSDVLRLGLGFVRDDEAAHITDEIRLVREKTVFERDKRRSVVAHRGYQRYLLGCPVAPEAGMFGGDESRNRATRRPVTLNVTDDARPTFGLSAGGIP